MRAVVLYRGGNPDALKPEDVPLPEPGPGMARVRLKAAGMNHRDLWQRKSYPGPGPMILGSDGAGVVEQVGSAEDAEWVGHNVVINPSLYWGDREDAPGPGYQILGNPTPGTYAEAVVVPTANLSRRPEHLSFEQAAGLPLAGLTAWRALFTQGALRAGQTLLLPGIGSGVAGMALTFAKRAGVRVIVTSSSEEKLESARKQGADFAANYTDDQWENRVRTFANAGGIDLVLDHTGEKTLPAALRLVRSGGRIVFLGATTGTQMVLNLRDAFFKQVHLVGTTMGSPREFQAMVRFVEHHRIPLEMHHTYPLAEAAEAHRFMDGGRQYGKIVLTIAD